MNQGRFLHVVHLPLLSTQQIAAHLRIHRLCFERCKRTDAMLFLCDLEDAHAATLPGDADLIRCVQSGVMSMNARRPGKYLFFVRKREKNAALSLYLGEHQSRTPREAIHALLSGEEAGSFEASNIGEGQLKNAFDTVLIVHAALRALPDTPQRLFMQRIKSGKPALRARVSIPARREEALFVRLLRAGFTLEPTALRAALTEEEPPAAIYTAKALSIGPAVHTQADCVFFLYEPPALSDLFSRRAVEDVKHGGKQLFLPLLLTAALFICAISGAEWPALALLLAEWRALVHPRLLPGALIRLSFLPRLALASLNALLRRRLANKKYRLYVSSGTGVCPFFGGVLLFLALRSVGALTLLLVVGLLWLAAPLIDRALALPARERIPLDDKERRKLHRLTKEAFDALDLRVARPAHLLAACAGCMLGYLEPDEAARRAQNMLASLRAHNAFDAACILASAQYLSERMADCDAALRPLPVKLEALARPAMQESENSPLAALLLAAQEDMPGDAAVAALSHAGSGSVMESLFLSFQGPGKSAQFTPMTHPHTWLKQLCLTNSGRAQIKKSGPPSPQEEADRFLMLACVALGGPFHGLLMRSPRVAPYAPLWDLA